MSGSIRSQRRRAGRGVHLRQRQRGVQQRGQQGLKLLRLLHLRRGDRPLHLRRGDLPLHLRRGNLQLRRVDLSLRRSRTVEKVLRRRRSLWQQRGCPRRLGEQGQWQRHQSSVQSQLLRPRLPRHLRRWIRTMSSCSSWR